MDQLNSRVRSSRVDTSSPGKQMTMTSSRPCTVAVIGVFRGPPNGTCSQQSQRCRQSARGRRTTEPTRVQSQVRSTTTLRGDAVEGRRGRDVVPCGRGRVRKARDRQDRSRQDRPGQARPGQDRTQGQQISSQRAKLCFSLTLRASGGKRSRLVLISSVCISWKCRFWKLGH